MNTKLLMAASALVMGVAGVTASFFPEEILAYFKQPATELLTLAIQITGALYLGFAFMNWMAKSVLIGGIYAKPLCMGNLCHFTIAGLALLKASVNSPGVKYVWLLTFVYLTFALLFGIVFFASPKEVNK